MTASSLNFSTGRSTRSLAWASGRAGARPARHVMGTGGEPDEVPRTTSRRPLLTKNRTWSCPGGTRHSR